MFRLTSLFALVFAFIGATGIHAQDTRALFQTVVRSAVFIVRPEGGGISMGSGSLLDREQRILITNYHVVGDADWVFVLFPIDDEKGNLVTDKKLYKLRIREEKAFKAKVLKVDMKRDLAIIKLETAPPPETPALPLAKNEPEQGDKVWNIGSPGAVEQLFSITTGNVRAVAKEKLDIGGDPKTMLRLDCRIITATNPTNPGDSGGPLVNSSGEMVGVTQSVSTGAVKLVNMFVSVNEVKAFLKENKIEVKVTPPMVKKVDPKPKETETPKEVVKKGPTPEQEKGATEALKLAKIYANNEDKRDLYIDKLAEIVKKYPGTVSGLEAKRVLDGLKK